LVGDLLGKGGNASVYRARHVETNFEAAIKEIRARHVEREPYQRFLTEIETLRGLRDYPGILPVLDDHIPAQPSATDQPWLVMPVARPLRVALVDSDLRQVVEAVAEIAETLDGLKRDHGIAHRDLKPSNLYEFGGRAVVGDFGLVALPDRGELTKGGKPLGPANFMPFEMLNDPSSADPFPADVYSLAKTLWVLASGVDYPPPGNQPAAAAPYRIADYRPYPNASLLDELVDRATRLDPSDRPTMEAFARDLRAWLALSAEQKDFDLTDAAAAVRESLGQQISHADKVDRSKDGCQAAIRRLEELVAPLNETLKAADPRARLGVIDSYTDRMLRFPEVMGSPEVALHWTRTSMLTAGTHLPYVLRMGRGVELVDDGTVVIRAMLDIGLEGVTSDVHWTAPERQVPVGSAEQEAALRDVTAELVEHLEAGLRHFAASAGRAG
jgi:serine/threonine protein kinase